MIKVNSFEDLLQAAKEMQVKTNVAVVCAQDLHTLQAVVGCVQDGIIDATLIGKTDEIKAILSEIGADSDAYTIIEAADVAASLAVAVELINCKKCGALMKGKLQTGELMKAVVTKENNLKEGDGLLSLIGLYKLPSYKKMFAVSDMGMNTYPDLQKKKAILENGVRLLRAIGREEPKVACLCAVETENPKMPDTVDAAALKKMNQQGIIKNCIVEGPISLDLAISKESAAIKGYQSPVCGEVDFFLVPDIVTGNVFTKCLVDMAGSATAGTIVGAKCPIILMSRSATAEDKYNAIALAAVAAENL